MFADRAHVSVQTTADGQAPRASVRHDLSETAVSSEDTSIGGARVGQPWHDRTTLSSAADAGDDPAGHEEHQRDEDEPVEHIGLGPGKR
jgi:hypothetical protein